MTTKELIKGCLEEDRKCQEALFKKYSGKMLALCMRYAKHRLEAEDLLQDGFVKAFSKLHQFKEDGAFEYWLRRIMINTAIKNLRKSSTKNEMLTGDAMPYDNGQRPKAYSDLGTQELMALINDLPDGYRMVFNMYAIEGYSHREIAETLDIQESTSRSQLVKARKILQEKILKRQKSVA